MVNNYIGYFVIGTSIAQLGEHLSSSVRRSVVRVHLEVFGDKGHHA